MAFAPSERTPSQLSAVWRTLFFWLFMLLLAVVLWKMSSTRPDSGRRDELNYSDFMQQVDKNNVASAQLLMGQSTSRVRGALREPGKQYSTTVPKEVIPDLTERLRKQGVPVTVSEAKDSTFVSAIFNFAPLVLLVFFWIFMMKRFRDRQQTKP